MDEIDWNHRLIGIKGTRGVGKTTFLLQYAKERFGNDRSCLYINLNNFSQEVLNSDKPVLLDFWAPWCGPCRMVVPMVEQIAEERPDIKVGKVNIDEQLELASQFGIMSIPTLLVMRGGEVVKRASGARPKQAILEMLQ